VRILFTSCFVWILCLASYGQGSVRFLVDDYKYALKRAKKEKKLVFVDTYASWCKPCKKQEPVFRDRSLAQFFNDHFVNVKVDMDKDLGKSLALRYSVVFLPTLMILDENGHVRYRSDQSFSADILSAEELLKIAMSTAYPEKHIASTAAPSPSVATPSTTNSEPKPKYRHVQHTPLHKDKSSKDIASQKSEKVTNDVNTKQSQIKRSEIPSSSDEKILYVLGEGDDVPPEVLREEAYFRLSLMDGSHQETVKKYLRTQEDWSTDENMKFLFDFLYTTRADEFTYLIINRHKFEKLLGKQKVANSIDILVNQTLERAYPRPDRKEAQALYSYLDRFSSREKGLKYHLSNLYHEKKIDQYMPLAKEYLEEMNPADTDVMYTLANTISEFSSDKKSLKYALKLIDKSINIGGEQFRYLDTKAFIYYQLGDKKKSTKTAYIAIDRGKAKNQDVSSTLELLKLLENL